MLDEMQRFQLERVNGAFFSPRAEGSPQDRRSELFHSLVQMVSEGGYLDQEKAATIASRVFVLDDGLFDSSMADAFHAHTGARVKLNPPEEEDYFTGSIKPLHADWEIHFD